MRPRALVARFVPLLTAWIAAVGFSLPAEAQGGNTPAAKTKAAGKKAAADTKAGSKKAAAKTSAAAHKTAAKTHAAAKKAGHATRAAGKKVAGKTNAAAKGTAAATESAGKKTAGAAKAAGAKTSGAAKNAGKKTAGAAKAAGNKTAAAAKKTPSVGQALGNGALTATIKTEFAADKDVPASTINIDSSDGVVTLQGHVDNDQQKAKAEQIARKTKGVKKVINKLTVGGKGAKAPAAPARKK